MKMEIGMTAKELYDMIKENVDEGDMGWDTQITFANERGDCYAKVHGANIECNGYEFRLYE